MNYRIYDFKNPIPDEYFEKIYSLLEISLPQIEMRTKSDQKALLSNEKYKIMVAEKENVFAGFIAIWDFEKFCFIEHFAVQPDMRSKGVGSEILRHITKIFHKKIILEVEPPFFSNYAQRRIGFYARNEFLFNDFEYFQPPLQKDAEIIPLKIMSYPASLTETEFIDIRKILYKEVYNFSKTLD